MAEYLVRKLQHVVELDAHELARVHRLSSGHTRDLPFRGDIVREGESAARVSLLLDGYAARYKVLEDGRRQITGLLLPGDFCDLRVLFLRAADHSIATLSRARVADVSLETFISFLDSSPRLARAVWWSHAVSDAIAMEWLVNLGRRTASERLAHLLCEVFLRLRAVGLTSEGGGRAPFTQNDLADALGLSTVHIGRLLAKLRAAGVVELRSKTLYVPNVEALQRAARFNPNYLHLD